jgi:hypothetical protein
VTPLPGAEHLRKWDLCRVSGYWVNVFLVYEAVDDGWPRDLREVVALFGIRGGKDVWGWHRRILPQDWNNWLSGLRSFWDIFGNREFENDDQR